MEAILIYLFFMFVWIESSHVDGISPFFWCVNIPIWIVILGVAIEGCTGL